MSHLEIEKRYLCRANSLIKYLKKRKIRYSKSKLEQFYLIANVGETLRYRREENRYIKNRKIGTGLVREELEEEIDRDSYEEAKRKNSGGVIKKYRYRFVLEDNLYELDIFKGKLEGLSILEVEFRDIESANSFIMPKILKRFIIKEITNENIYSNGALSKSMKVPLRRDSKISLNEIKKSDKIAKKADFDLYISDYENSKYALINSFKRDLIAIDLNLSEFLTMNKIENIKNIESALFDIKSLLKCYKNYIKKRSYKNILININNIMAILDNTIKLNKSFKYLLKKSNKRGFDIKLFKDALKVAKLQKIDRDSIINSQIVDIFKKLNSEISNIKFKKSIEKPFYYYQKDIKNEAKKALIKSINRGTIVDIYRAMRFYKRICKYINKEFKFKKEYKKIKKLYYKLLCSSYSNIKEPSYKSFQKVVIKIAKKI